MARERGKLGAPDAGRIGPGGRARLDSFCQPMQRSGLVTIEIDVRARSEDVRRP